MTNLNNAVDDCNRKEGGLDDGEEGATGLTSPGTLEIEGVCGANNGAEGIDESPGGEKDDLEDQHDDAVAEEKEREKGGSSSLVLDAKTADCRDLERRSKTKAGTRREEVDEEPEQRERPSHPARRTSR